MSDYIFDPLNSHQLGVRSKLNKAEPVIIPTLKGIYFSYPEYSRPTYNWTPVPPPVDLKQGYDAIFQLDERILSRYAEHSVKNLNLGSIEESFEFPSTIDNSIRQRIERIGINITNSTISTVKYNGVRKNDSQYIDDAFGGAFETEGLIAELRFSELIITDLGTTPKADLIWHLTVDVQVIETDEHYQNEMNSIRYGPIYQPSDHNGYPGFPRGYDGLGPTRRAKVTRRIKLALGTVTIPGTINLISSQNYYSVRSIFAATRGPILWSKSILSGIEEIDGTTFLSNVINQSLNPIINSDINVSPFMTLSGRRPADLIALGAFNVDSIVTEGNVPNNPVLSIAIELGQRSNSVDLLGVRPFLENYTFGYCTSSLIINSLAQSLWNHLLAPEKQIQFIVPIEIEHTQDGQVVSTEQGEASGLLTLNNTIAPVTMVANGPNVPSALETVLSMVLNITSWRYSDGTPIPQQLPDPENGESIWDAFPFDDMNSLGFSINLTAADQMLSELHKWIYEPAYFPFIVPFEWIYENPIGDIFSSVDVMVSRINL